MSSTTSKIILDVGCGAHKSTPEAIGIDIRPVTDVTASAEALPFIDNYADIIISRHSFEHLLDPATVIKEWIRVLRPEGKIIFVLPDHEYMNTMDVYYSAGEHLHAYTRHSFTNFIRLFPELTITSVDTVIRNWSFGVVVKKLPKVSILIPTLDRPEGLKRCVDSISRLNYPTHLIETLIDDGPGTVPEKVKRLYEKSTGQVIVYAANDVEFTPESVYKVASLDTGLVSFNTGELLPDKGNICEHFAIKRWLVPMLENGEIFSTDFFHAGCDNWLWTQASELGEARRCDDAIVHHHHFIRGAPMDDIYKRAYSRADEDRRILAAKLQRYERGSVSHNA